MLFSCELPHPPALGAPGSSLVGGGASWFCVGMCIRRGHSGSGLPRRFPFTGGSECPTPPGWTLNHNRRCALRVALEHHRRRGEHRTTLFVRRGSNCGGDRVCEPCGRCLPSLLRSLRSLRGERGRNALTAEAKTCIYRSAPDTCEYKPENRGPCLPHRISGFTATKLHTTRVGLGETSEPSGRAEVPKLDPAPRKFPNTLLLPIFRKTGRGKRPLLVNGPRYS